MKFIQNNDRDLTCTRALEDRIDSKGRAGRRSCTVQQEAVRYQSSISVCDTCLMLNPGHQADLLATNGAPLQHFAHP